MAADGGIGELAAHLERCPYEALKGYIAERDVELALLREEVGRLQAMMAINKPENLMPSHCLSSHTACVVSLAVFNNLLFSGSMDGTVKVWNTSPFTVVKELSLGPTFQLKLNANRLYSAHADSVKVWNLTAPNPLAATISHDVGVKALFIMDDLLFAGTGTGEVKVWNLTNMTPVHTISGAHKGEIREIIAEFNSTLRTPLLWTTGDDGYVRVWNSRFECFKAFRAHVGPIRTMNIIHLDKIDLLLTGSDDTFLKVWDITNFLSGPSTFGGSLVCLKQTCCFSGISAVAVLSQAVTPGAKIVVDLVSGHGDGTIRWWSLEVSAVIGGIAVALNRKRLLSLHEDRVRVIIPHGTGFISGSYDKTIRICPYPQQP
ncbi:WD40 repeat [Pelomyxa schiedti]|nr:WD40 repeat [Pelomyxa schiedti]